MGRKSRAKRERQDAAAERPAENAPRKLRTIVLLATGAVVLVGIVVAIVVALSSGAGSLPSGAQIASAAGTSGPVSLAAAAAAIDFHPTLEPGVGQMEGLPASAAHPPLNKDLLPVGSEAPAFSLKTPTGKTVSLADYRGKAVLLEFFATWCPHCQAEAPHLAQLASSLSPSRYAFVSVNADGEDAASVYAYDRYFKVPYPSLLDPSSRPGSFYQAGGAGAVTSAYRVQDFPTFYIIAPDGRITWRSDQEQPDALLLRELEHAAGK